MGDTNQEPERTKIILFIISAFIGMCAKLANMHKEKPLTFFTVTRQVSITTMASWLVWWICKKYNQDEITTYIFGCITASFSHQVIMLMWTWVKNSMNNFLNTND